MVLASHLAHQHAVSSVGSSTITKRIGDRQAQWASMTQSRLTKTKTVLSEIKGIKMMGLEGQVGNLLQEERVQELKQLKKFNWVMVWVNVVGMFSYMRQ
jgi:ATP-binding cassette, subfamily C (CFTR/MRP), member 1